jgi:hypothetical protein
MTPSGPALSNIDFDTGKETVAGEYPLADKCYDDWVLLLEETNFDLLDLSEKENILAFYAKPIPHSLSRKGVKRWTKVTHAIAQLKVTQPKTETASGSDR